MCFDENLDRESWKWEAMQSSGSLTREAASVSFNPVLFNAVFVLLLDTSKTSISKGTKEDGSSQEATGLPFDCM